MEFCDYCNDMTDDVVFCLYCSNGVCAAPACCQEHDEECDGELDTDDDLDY